MTTLGLGAALAATLALAPAAFAKDWKTVVIGMEGAYEPCNLTDSERQDRRLRARSRRWTSASAHGVECKIIAQDWDGMIPGLQGGQVRRHHGRHVDHRRAQEVDRLHQALRGFARRLSSPPKDSPLAKATGAGTVINMTRTRRPATPRSSRLQAALKGKTLGVQVSTTHANFADQYFKDVATIKEYKTTDDRDLDLKSGRIDASLDD